MKGAGKQTMGGSENQEMAYEGRTSVKVTDVLCNDPTRATQELKYIELNTNI